MHYSEEQKALGRFQRAPNVRLRDVMQWLDHWGVVPDDARLQALLAFGFLLVCLVNTVGLMLAKFMRRDGRVERAARAGRIEGERCSHNCWWSPASIGLAGGIGGLLLALLGLWLVRQRPSEYAALAHLDLGMLLTTFALAVVAALLAGLLPAWRACQVAPALQLKSN